MGKVLAIVMGSALVGGCLSSSAPRAAHWSIDYCGPMVAANDTGNEVARLLQVSVRAPYNAIGLTVLRADGTVEADPLNEYAAPPPQLIKAVAYDAMEASGLFKEVVEGTSAASAPLSVEVVVTRMALDCRKAGARRAVAGITVRLLRNHDILRTVKGEGEVDAADGNFGAAISGAVSTALISAFGQLR